MARRRRAERRNTVPDPKYENVELARLINRIMMCGKKSVAQRIAYGALDLIQKETGQAPLGVFTQAIKNTTPLLEVKPRRVGGATYQVPVEVRPERGEALAMRWILTAARGRTGVPRVRKLAAELIEASKSQGAAAKRREDLHKMAEANRAFVHYNW